MARRRPETVDDALLPTSSRIRRRDIERLDAGRAVMPDADGAIGQPFRTVDTLAKMEKRGAITKEMHEAGKRFRDDFALAALDPLKAADMGRVPVSGGRPAGTPGSTSARNEVWRAVVVLGGLTSPAGSCVWDVLGWNISLREWALREGWSGKAIDRDTASGILIGALGVLQRHYGM